MTGNPGGDDTIRVKRRRQGASGGPSGDERAEMPSRERQRDSGGPLPPSFGGGGDGGGGGRAPRLPIGVVVLILIGYAIYSLFFSGNSGSQTEPSLPPTEPAVFEPATEVPVQSDFPTSTPAVAKPATAAPAQNGVNGQKWTVMLYQDADDQILEQDILMDLNEVERVGSSDRVQIVSQVDRFKGAYAADGNWTSTRRYHITKDNDLTRVRSELIDDLGEQDMADGNTLADFVTWAAKTYPADKYVLILSDHGMGWPGGWSDPDPATRDTSNTQLASALEDDQLYLMELGNTLQNLSQSTGIGKFEVIGMDACLMGHLEVLSALEPYARYAVVSQETEPALGWAYTGFLQALVDNPDMSGADLSAKVVSSYIKDDQRINDEQARADFLRQGSPLGGLFGGSSQVSAASLAQQLSRDVTLTAVDLSRVPDLITSVNTLAYTLQNEKQEVVASARNFAPAYTNIFGKGSPSPYIDLGGFVQMLKRQGGNSKTSQAADDVLAKIKSAVVAEKHGSGKAGSNGVSIYFPISTLYRSPIAGARSYTAIAKRFAQVSLWDDYLAYHYNDISFKPDARQPVTPQVGAPSRAPGLEQIQLSPISASGKTASPGNPVTLTTKVTGKNVGYAYFFAGFYDKKSNSIYEADTDFLESPTTKELSGVYYPEWSAKPFNMELEWDPTLFQITDGQNTTVALFTPQTYGASATDAVYTIDGTYHYADGADRSARLYFRDGVMRQVFGFTDQNETGGAREIIPQDGDTFTISEKWLDLDANGKVTQAASQDGETLTFGNRPFQWKEVYAAPGDYIVGFIVEDLDGNSQEVYTTITVR